MPAAESLEAIYRQSVVADVRNCIEEKNCRPILFLGSGFAQRYFGLPNWTGLLRIACDACPRIERELNYHYQRHNDNNLEVAEDFAESYFEWGWDDRGNERFPEECYADGAKRQSFLKSFVATHLTGMMASYHSGDRISGLAEELALLQRIRPYAVITTNYDTGVELVLPDYGVIVGERILRADTNNLGDILKIHGCVSDPGSIVLTKSDYDGYRRQRKYLSAKLLTYFAEHPMVFVGYSVSDPNIHEILADIDEVLACNGEQVPNLYVVNYREPTTSALVDTPIRTSEHHFVRVKEICSRDFGWIYEAFGYQGAVDLDVRTLRLLQSQMHKLVRSDAPGGKIMVNYQTLKGVLEQEEGLTNVLGICPLNDPAQVNATYPFRLTDVGQQLGYRGWNQAKKLVDSIKQYKGVDICVSDNRYHFAIPNGNNKLHKYSHEAVELLKAVRDNLEYEVTM